MVEISARAMAVAKVTVWPIRMMNKVPVKPTDPTAKPNRRNMIAPRMVEMAVRKTGKVPKFDLVVARVLELLIDLFG